jgi:hypothetical protein
LLENRKSREKESTVKRHAIVRAAALVVAVLWPGAVQAQSETTVTAGGGGIFPSSVSYKGVPLNALKFGLGVTIGGGSAEGQFHTTLIGVSGLGLEQRIEVEGKASIGSSGAETVTFAGNCTVDMGDLSQLLTDVPFTLAVATNALTLTLGTTNFPAATVSEGSVTIK